LENLHAGARGALRGEGLSFGHDQNGLYKVLEDGQVLRIAERLFNTMLTLSNSLEDPGWLEGW
jgi:hypothetical protein